MTEWTHRIADDCHDARLRGWRCRLLRTGSNGVAFVTHEGSGTNRHVPASNLIPLEHEPAPDAEWTHMIDWPDNPLLNTRRCRINQSFGKFEAGVAVEGAGDCGEMPIPRNVLRRLPSTASTPATDLRATVDVTVRRGNADPDDDAPHSCVTLSLDDDGTGTAMAAGTHEAMADDLRRAREVAIEAWRRMRQGDTE